MTRKAQIQMSFVRAFYGDGQDIDRAITAWAIYDYWKAMGQIKLADCFDKIAVYYFERHKVTIQKQGLWKKSLTNLTT